MKAAIYCRVSTADQHTDNQLDSLKAWAQRREFTVVQVYQENETAWKAGHQRELAKLLDRARQGRFRVIMVWSLDRLSREGSLAILSLVEKLKTYGVKVLSYQEAWTDAPGELAELLYSITGWVARMESQRRSERTRAGLERAKRNGQALGRPPGARDKRKRKKVSYADKN